MCRRNDRNDKQRRRPKSQSAPTSRGQSDFGEGDFDRRISFSRDKSRNRDRDHRDRGDHRDREHGDRNNQVKKQSGSKLEQYRNRTKTEQKSETEQRSDQETNNLDLNRTGSNRNNHPNNQRRKNNRGKSRGRYPDDPNADDNFRREVIVGNHKDDRIGKWRLTAVRCAVNVSRLD